MRPAAAASRRRGPRATRSGTSASTRASAPGIDRFAADVRHYLSQSPRQLPSRYLYDDLGSALFEAICRLPWYPLTRAELRLLGAHGPEILDRGVASIVELGAGSGLKLSSLIRAAGPHRGPFDVHVVDVSASALAGTRHALAEFRDLRVMTHETTYETGLEILRGTPPARGRRLMLFLGSNLGNFDPEGRDLFLRAMRGALRPGDRLLLGADLVKPVREPAFYAYAYPEPAGCPQAAIRPAEASYHPVLREWILPYEALRRSSSPDTLVLDFLESTYETAARLGGWDRAALERKASTRPDNGRARRATGPAAPEPD